MIKCSLYKKPHFICKRLILSKIYCFEVKAFWWGCFKGVSSLSYLCLAGNVDAILDGVTGLVFLPCTWIISVIRKCFWKAIWGQQGQGIRLNFDIFICCMDTFLFLCMFHCGSCSLLIFSNLLLLIHTSIYFSLFLLLFCSFLCFPNSFIFSPRFFLTFKIFLLLPHWIIITQ